MSGIFDEVKELLTMQQVVGHFGFKPNRAGFIALRNEKNPSCRIYERSYYDFGSCEGGDMIKFAAKILGTSNWDSCRYLIEAFSLPISLIIDADQQAEIERRKEARRQQQERERQFNNARLRAIDDFHFERRLWESAFENKVFSPFSEQCSNATKTLQIINYQLDVLCGLTGCRADQEKLLIGLGYMP